MRGLDELKLKPSASAPARQASMASTSRVIPQILIFVMGIVQGESKRKVKKERE
jgi:hypothetical protein